MDKIKISISSCLLGEKVRYDGGNKLDRFLTDTMGKYVEYVPVCPEVECGLGVPRKSMRLEGNPASPRLIVTGTGKDLTERLESFARKKVLQLEKENICGFIAKSDSPSCGIHKVKVFNEKLIPIETGTGIFTSIFITHFSSIPVEEEECLHDPGRLENFMEKIFAYAKQHAK